MTELTVSDHQPLSNTRTVKHLIVESAGDDEQIDYDFYHNLKDLHVEQLTIVVQSDNIAQGIDWSGLRCMLSSIPSTVTRFSLCCNTTFLGEKIDLSWIPGKFDYFEFNLVEHVKKWAGHTYYSSVRCAITGIPNAKRFVSGNPMECATVPSTADVSTATTVSSSSTLS